jgi:minimal PKS acyl carrier protein
MPSESAAPARLTYELLADLVRECAGVPVEVTALRRPDTVFTDLDVDSLGVLGVVAALERVFAVSLDATARTAAPHALLHTVNGELERRRALPAAPPEGV